MYEYADISGSEVLLIKELWNKNREYHIENSSYFSYEYDNLFFEDRMKIIFDRSEKIKVSIAKDICGNPVAYCFSTISNESEEIKTLFVDEKHRGNGIARKLLNLHREWIFINGCKEVSVAVLHDNKHSVSLYENIGFKKIF